jgi:hypothetical protein
MLHAVTIPPAAEPAFSELVLSDRLITLAEDADRAGYTTTAERLLKLACGAFDKTPPTKH